MKDLMINPRLKADRVVVDGVTVSKHQKIKVSDKQAKEMLERRYLGRAVWVPWGDYASDQVVPVDNTRGNK